MLTGLRHFVRNISAAYTFSLSDLTLREEAQLRLEGSGHVFHYHQTADLLAVMLSSEQVCNLNQIVRELVSNIIRHARADSVALELTVENHYLHLQMADHGKGLASAGINGNGLCHVRLRVAELHGKIAMETTAGGGLTLQLMIPLVVADAIDLTPVQTRL